MLLAETWQQTFDDQDCAKCEDCERWLNTQENSEERRKRVYRNRKNGQSKEWRGKMVQQTNVNCMLVRGRSSAKIG